MCNNPLFYFPLLIRRCKSFTQRQSTNGITTRDAPSRASPSCTITPTSSTSITITPFPVTALHAPGAITPVVLTFDRVTIASFQPKSTVFANNGDGVLTLRTATLTDLKATATASYLVQTSDATSNENLELDVVAEAQLFFAFNNDDQGSEARSLERGLMKRHSLLLDVRDANKTWIDATIEDAKMALYAMATRLNAHKNDDGKFKAAPDLGLNDYWHKYERPRLLLMVHAQIATLDGPDEVVLTASNSNKDQRTLACSSNDDERAWISMAQPKIP